MGQSTNHGVDTIPRELITNSAAETEGLGSRLAALLARGSVMALYGELGSGKTCLVRGLARGLGFAGKVTSPTFVIVNIYRGGRLPLYHIDCYRLSDATEMNELGYEEFLDGDGICCIEWAERVERLFSNYPHVIRVHLEHVDENRRKISFNF